MWNKDFFLKLIYWLCLLEPFANDILWGISTVWAKLITDIFGSYYVVNEKVSGFQSPNNIEAISYEYLSTLPYTSPKKKSFRELPLKQAIKKYLYVWRTCQGSLC